MNIIQRVCAGAVIICSLFLLACSGKKKDSEEPNSGTLAVHGLEIVSAPLISTIYGAGIVRGEEEVPVISKTQGTITNVSFEAGSKVKAGQILATVENAALRSAMEQAKAILSSAETAFNVSKKLLAAGAVSKTDVNRDKAHYYGAQAQYRARLEQYQDSIIKAPVDGYVVEKNPAVTTGSVIGSGTVVGRISARSAVKIIVPVADAYVSFIAVDDPARVTVSSISDFIYDARVSGIASGADAATGSVSVTLRIALSEDQISDVLKEQLRTGLTASAEIPVLHAPEYPIIPQTVINTENDRQYIYIARLPEGFSKTSTPSQPVPVIKAFIATGRDFAGNVEVHEGLDLAHSTDTFAVIISGISHLSEGKLITVTLVGSTDTF